MHNNNKVLDLNRMYKKALDYHNQGNLEQAKNLYENILSRYKNHAESMHLLGMIYYTHQDYNKALELVEKAVLEKPDNLSLKINLATIYKEINIFSAAETLLKGVLAINPNFPSALYNLANLYKDQQKFDLAISLYNKAIKTRPQHAATWLNLGYCYNEKKQYIAALKAYNKSLEIESNNFIVYNNIGSIYRLIPEIEFRKLKLDKTTASISESNYTIKYKLAFENYNKSLEYNPLFAEAWRNIGVANYDLAQFEEADKAFLKAIQLGDNLASFHRSNLLLLLKEYDEGFYLYEKRFKTPFAKPRCYDYPFWKNEDLTDKVILLWGEQALGDEIMFASLLDKIYKQAKLLILEINHRLVPIFQRSFPNAIIIPMQKKSSNELIEKQILEILNKNMNTDNNQKVSLLTSGIEFQFPLLSLGKYLKPYEYSKLHSPYLISDSAKKLYFINKYKKLFPNKKLIGISWHSINDLLYNRSLELNDLLPLFKNPNIQFISVQYGDHKKEIKEFNKSNKYLYFDDEVDALQDMDQLFAQIDSLDLVISIANSTVHVAGAPSKPCWVMLPFIPSWRWAFSGDDNIWYNNIKIFRQPTLNDWSSVVNDIFLKL